MSEHGTVHTSIDDALNNIEYDKWAEVALIDLERGEQNRDAHAAREENSGEHAEGALFQFPADQTVHHARPRFRVRTVYVENWATVDFTVTFTSGESITCRAGKCFPFSPPYDAPYTVQSNAAGSGYFALVCYPFRMRPPAGFDVGSPGASGSNVTVTNFPATQPVSGNVGVNNFPATQPVSAAVGAFADGAQTTIGLQADAAYVAGNGTVVSVLKGIFGRLANIVSLAFNAAGALIVDDRAAANQSATQVSVATTAGGTQIVAARATRKSVALRNTDATNPIYLGANGVTAATGFLLKAGESVTLQNTTAIYGLATGGAVTVCAFEEYA